MLVMIKQKQVSAGGSTWLILFLRVWEIGLDLVRTWMGDYKVTVKLQATQGNPKNTPEKKAF